MVENRISPPRSPAEDRPDSSREYIPGPGPIPVTLFLLVLLLGLAFIGLVRFPGYSTAVVLDPNPHGPTALVADPGASTPAAGSPVTATQPGGATVALVVEEAATLQEPHEFGYWGVPASVETPAQVLRLRPQENGAEPVRVEPGAQLSVRTMHATLLQYAIDFVRTG